MLSEKQLDKILQESPDLPEYPVKCVDVETGNVHYHENGYSDPKHQPGSFIYKGKSWSISPESARTLKECQKYAEAKDRFRKRIGIACAEAIANKIHPEHIFEVLVEEQMRY